MRLRKWSWAIVAYGGPIVWTMVAAGEEAPAMPIPPDLQGVVGGANPVANTPAVLFASDRILVRFRAGTTRSSKENSVVRAKGIRSRRSYKCVRDLELIEVPAGSVSEVIRLLLADSNVAYAEPDYRLELSQVPNDPRFAELWGLENTAQIGQGSFCYSSATAGADIGATRAWSVWTGDPDFRIAVIDTGVNYLHPDLVDNVWTNPNEFPGDANGDGCPGVCGVDEDGDGLVDEDANDRLPGDPSYQASFAVDDDENGFKDDIHGYDPFNNDGDPFDDNSHGSHVSGTIGAVGNNEIGVAGINWRCKIVALKIFGRTGAGGGISDAIESLEYIIAARIRVSNNSWGFSGGFSQALRDAIEASQAVGHIFVAAAGNDFGRSNDHLPQYPASYDLPNIIAVGALDNHYERAIFSNIGVSTVDLAAPGACILSTVLDSDYGYKDGTSMATPHVAGVVALVTSRYPELNWRQIRERILYTVRPNPAFEDSLFRGSLDALAAIGDCNHNGNLDAHDISGGTSLDCTGNGIPDECEPDCNANGRADSCDLFDRISLDCNDNGLPDECEPDCNGNSLPDSCDVSAGLGRNCNRNWIPDACEIAMESPAPGGPFYCMTACAPDCNNNAIPDSCDLGSGTSSDCSGNRVPDECEPDCNLNGRADSCDLDQGFSTDCGNNRIPDECEPDCNANGRADTCDIYASTSTDCNRNAVPDECEPAEHADCNTNLVSDRCEVIRETSFDCNSNGTLDECDIRDGFSLDVDGTHIPDECDGRGFMIIPVSATGDHSIQGNEIRMLGGGQRVTLDIRLLNWDLDLDGDPRLRAYELRIDAGGFTSGRYGHLSPARIPCTNDLDCFGDSVCQTDGYCNYRGPIFIDPYRPDYIFGGRLSVQIVNPFQFAPDITYLGALWSQSDVIRDDGASHYLGTLILDVSQPAAGTFTVGFVPRSSQLRRSTSDPITVPTVTPVRIIVDSDCNLNDIPDLEDIDGGLSDDCDGNGVPDECLFVEGDCNRNGHPDRCDILEGFSIDCDADGSPDECVTVESDCNRNGLPDACDLIFGISVDCNLNGIPDDCIHLERDCNNNNNPDFCDIASGISLDCNSNRIPDDCLRSERDCNANFIPDGCDLASGFSEDCNDNAVPDSCDLAAGTSDDCNENGIPDECRRFETDCNQNESPDECDLADLVSRDCNENQVPDECDVASGTSPDSDGDGVPDECDRLHFVPADFPTLAEAISAAQSGDLILVADGVYSGPGNTSLSFLGKRLTLRSENGPTRCVIDGRKAGRGFTFVQSENAESRLEGFTITGGYAEQGGAIYCRRSSPTIAHCIIANNTAGLYGGGIYCETSANPVLTHCIFVANTAGHDGAAVYCENMSSPRIDNCLITQNFAAGAGGGIYCDNLSNPLVRHCTFAANRAAYGGAVYCARASIFAPGFSAPVLRNSILWANSVSGEGREIYMARGSQLAVEASAILGGLNSVVVRAPAELHWDPINIVENPAFRDPTGTDGDFSRWEDNDFRLQYLSPCIDTGMLDPAPPALDVDLDGSHRILCGLPDMGAYESGIGDFDCNRKVEVADQRGWAACATGPVVLGGREVPDEGAGCNVFDFEIDGDVDLEDLARFYRQLQP